MGDMYDRWAQGVVDSMSDGDIRDGLRTMRDNAAGSRGGMTHVVKWEEFETTWESIHGHRRGYYAERMQSFTSLDAASGFARGLRLDPAKRDVRVVKAT